MQLIVAIIIVIIVYVLQHEVYKRIWNKNLDVDISFDDACIEVGETGGITEVINNAKLLPLSVLHVKFSADRSFDFIEHKNSTVTDCYYRNDAFSVMGNERITRHLKFIASKRGLYEIGKVNIITRDFFLTGNIASSLKQNSFMYVLPEKIYSEQLHIMLNKIHGELINRRSLLEDPYTFRGIREYDVTDTIRKINWKASAKSENLMVNMYDHTSEAKVCILLNLETNIMLKPETLRETAIKMSAAITEYFINHGIPVMVESNGTDCISGKCESVTYGASGDHALTIYKYLARIKENTGIETYIELINGKVKNLDKNVTYFFVTPYYKEDLLIKLDYLYSNGLDIHVLAPYYDIQKFDIDKPYIHGWEVRMNENGN